MQQWKGKSKVPPAPTLMSMSMELLDAIYMFLSQQSLRNLVLCSSNFREMTAQCLYMESEFASTYRFGQFTFIVVSQQHYYAQMVRSLKISSFDNLKDKRGEADELAGWREFKYRHQRLFTVPPQRSSFAFSLIHSTV
ncbi:hypothetical protein V8E51_006777 [Hyaloscypha variabilis]